MHFKQFQQLIVVPTLIEINYHSKAAVNLVMGTALVESELRYLAQIKGPALGVYQMEPNTHDDIWENYLGRKHDLSRSLINIAGDHSKALSCTMVYNLKYATAMCRAHYLRVPEPLPEAEDVRGLAQYWKAHYNTELGKGKVETFIEKTHILFKGY